MSLSSQKTLLKSSLYATNSSYITKKFEKRKDKSRKFKVMNLKRAYLRVKVFKLVIDERSTKENTNNICKNIRHE